MPNLVPPVTTVEHVLEYQNQPRELAPGVQFLMSLLLHPSVTPAVIQEAARERRRFYHLPEASKKKLVTKRRVRRYRRV